MSEGCNKKPFTKVQAATALNRNKKLGRKALGGKHRKELRYYHCPICNNWHLTSSPISPKPEIKEVDLIEKERWEKLLNKDE